MRRKRLFEASLQTETAPSPEAILVLAEDEVEVRRLLDGSSDRIGEIVEVLVPAAMAGPSRVVA